MPIAHWEWIRADMECRSTFWGAATEIDDILTNLRQSLYEERTYLRRARLYTRKRRQSAAARGDKRGRTEKDELGPEAAYQAMSTLIKHMIVRFKAIERRYLVDGIDRRQRRRREKDDEGALGYSSGIGEDEQADYLYAANRYRNCGFSERVSWVRHKGQAKGLMDDLQKMEVRRIGMQVSHMLMNMRDLGTNLEDALDGVDRLEQRMGRVLGVRRVE